MIISIVMKKTSSDIVVSRRIADFSGDLSGIFSTYDLYHTIGSNNPITNQRAIQRQVDAGNLLRVQKGFYVTPEFDLWMLAGQLNKNAYISMDSVLSKNGLIGTLTQRHVSLVGLASNKTIEFGAFRIDRYSISPQLFFGYFNDDTRPISVADNEKAFLDLLYYYNRGYRFAIDPKKEINIAKLDLKKLKLYLRKYKNPKFVRFVEGVVDGFQ